MLTIKTNNRKCKVTYKILDTSAIKIYEGKENGDIQFSMGDKKYHNLNSNDELLFERNDGENISFSKTVNIKSISGKTDFIINGFGFYTLYPNSLERVSIRNPFTDLVESFVKLTFDENNYHILCRNTDDIIVKTEYIYDYDAKEYVYSSGRKEPCNGDYVLFGGIYLARYFDDKFYQQNINGKYIFVNDDVETPYECVVPMNGFGNDDRSILLIKTDTNFDYTDRFRCDDIRFLHDNTFRYGINKQDGLKIYKVCGNLELELNIGENFETNLLHDEAIQEYGEKAAKDNINTAIDYEKHLFVPMYYNAKTAIDITTLDNNLQAVKKINFNINLRYRDFTSGETTFDDVDFGSWETKDKNLWNNFNADDLYTKLIYRDENINGNSTADMLGYLGFTDSDVYYQSNALKKSFLRLSFYDSNDRATQQLLYYSTIYFDTNQLFQDYCTNRNSRGNTYGDDNTKQIVFDSNFVKNGTALQAKMSCTDRFNEDSSSDGFYLYLFDKMVSGNNYNTIYMKAEFNNAKYGKTIPLTMPLYRESNAPIPATSTDFPKDYLAEDGTEIEYNNLLKDMYIKIYIKFDYKTNSYVWFLPKNTNCYDIDTTNHEINFTFFEPRVNDLTFNNAERVERNTYGGDNLPSWIDKDGWFDYNGVYYDKNDKPEENSDFATGACLYTSAQTLSTDLQLYGTKLFNSGTQIENIWINGIKVSDTFFKTKESNGKLVKNGTNTNKFQLPDLSFEVTAYEDADAHKKLSKEHSKKITITAYTHQDQWYHTGSQGPNGEHGPGFFQTLANKKKKYHRVNYYFKENLNNSLESLVELCSGVTVNTEASTKMVPDYDYQFVATDYIQDVLLFQNVTSGKYTFSANGINHCEQKRDDWPCLVMFIANNETNYNINTFYSYEDTFLGVIPWDEEITIPKKANIVLYTCSHNRIQDISEAGREAEKEGKELDYTYYQMNLQDGDIRLTNITMTKSANSERNKKTIEATTGIVNTLINNLNYGRQKIPNGMFNGINSLRRVMFKANKTNTGEYYYIHEIGDGAFASCNNLISVQEVKEEMADSGIVLIGKNAFCGNKSLKEFVSFYTSCIMKQAFQGCASLEKVIFNNTLLYLGNASFSHTGIRNVILPYTLMRIGDSAFRRCYTLESMSFNNSIDKLYLVSVGKRIFGGCNRFKHNLKSSIRGYYTYDRAIKNAFFEQLAEKENNTKDDPHQLIEFYSASKDKFIKSSIRRIDRGNDRAYTRPEYSSIGKSFLQYRYTRYLFGDPTIGKSYYIFNGWLYNKSRKK